MIKPILLAGLVAGFVVQAQAQVAGRTAPPPPSGEVIHLFGPNSVLGEILPTGPAPGGPASAVPAPEGATPESGAPAAPVGSVATGGTESAPASASATAAATPAGDAQTFQEPTLGAVLHQMFITGDRDAGPGFAPGRQKLH